MFAKIYCHKSEQCELMVGESKLSKIRVNLASNGHNLSYFSGQHITIGIELLKVKNSFEGKALGTPVQQFGAIKKAGMELTKVGICRE